MISAHQHRDGDTMVLVTVETRPAVIDYADIREAVKVEPDECTTEPPWEHCDGLEHTLRDLNNDEEINSAACVYVDGRRQIIDISTDHGIYEFLRNHGASRQTAREAVARDRQQSIEFLKKCYRDVWEWWRVSCRFLDVSAGLHGVDDYDYGNTDCADDIALEVARELQAKGYTVAGLPTIEDQRAHQLAGRRQSLKHNLQIGAWR